ncbi:MAG TPA: MBL fold metallo-hydrolase [Cellulomonas sp.]|nr:MBL fold metallo-hydrolase [Cellulomonas sp.]
MTDTGHVIPGGPTVVRTLDEVAIRTVSVGPMDNNAYLLTCRRSGAQLLVDAADDPDRLLALVREGSGTARLDLVVTTHRHADHVGALRSVVAVTGAHVAAGADDADAITQATETVVTRRLHGGDPVTAGHLTLQVVALRGHTPGSIALAYREPEHASAPGAVPGRVHLFTGDSLFPGGPGRTTSTETFTTLMDDLEARVFARFDDETLIYPGHGDPTTLGAERPHVPEWRARGW